MEKYGKPYGPIMKFKTIFSENNDELLEKSDQIANIYKTQPKRKKCKICGENIEHSQQRFEAHKVNYIICPKCEHLNGEFLETDDFSRKIYQENDYGIVYRESDINVYNDRRKQIYEPKAEFLIDVLRKKIGDSVSELNFLDVGAGSGYLVSALKKLGFNAKGIEISQQQVNYANKINSDEILEQCEAKNICDKILNTNAQVISFIGVLEHIIDLHEVLSAVNQNSNIKYIFFSVPMFSYSVILEAINEKVYNRQLGGVAAHTHLFSNKSLEWIFKKYDWNIIGKWIFGTDAADFMRMTAMTLEQKNEHYLSQLFIEKFKTILDKIQLEIDYSEFASEIHAVVEKM